MNFWFLFGSGCDKFVTRGALRGRRRSGMVLRNNAMKASHRTFRAFSLVELLSVIAVIVLMMSMMLPAISGFSSTAGRRGALNVLMNTFEQARVAALEAGRPVYVVLWRRQFPGMDSVMVLRENESGTGPYDQLTKWIKLPKGVLLHQPGAGSSILSATPPTSVFDPSRMPNAFTAPAGESINVLAFNESGGVSFPTTKAERKLIISEGVRGAGGTEALISTKKQGGGGFEIISISPYTGRAQLDVTTVQ